MFTQNGTHKKSIVRRAMFREDSGKGGTYSKLWIALLLALHLLAIGLPAGTVMAKSLAAGKPYQPCHQYDDGGPGAAVAAVAVPAANQQVTIPKSEVDKAIFFANWRSLPN